MKNIYSNSSTESIFNCQQAFRLHLKRYKPDSIKALNVRRVAMLQTGSTCDANRITKSQFWKQNASIEVNKNSSRFYKKYSSEKRINKENLNYYYFLELGTAANFGNFILMNSKAAKNKPLKKISLIKEDLKNGIAPT